MIPSFEQVRILLGAALVLWLPGYALTAALFRQKDLGAVERILLTVGSSVSMVILTGFGLNLVGVALTPLTWGVGLAAVTLGVGVFAWRPTHRPGLPHLDVFLSMPGRDWLLFGSAALIVVLALGLARLGADSQPQAGFTELTMVTADSDSVRVGLRSEESAALTYRIVLRTDTNVIAEWPAVPLEPGQRWDMQVVLPSNDKSALELLLYRADAPGEIYRRVRLGPVPTPGN